jgi:polysaccharide biosynthesis protein PslG
MVRQISGGKMMHTQNSLSKRLITSHMRQEKSHIQLPISTAGNKLQPMTNIFGCARLGKHRTLTLTAHLMLLLLTLSLGAHAQEASESARAQDPFSRLSVVPRGLGFNIYSGGESGIKTTDTASQINSVGTYADVGWIRVDFHWRGVPRIPDVLGKPVYIFDYYDDLMNKLKTQRLRPIFILNDMDPEYDRHDKNGIPNCYRENGQLNCMEQEEFARFVGQAVHHLKGQGIIWEMYNEPNLVDLWKIKFGQPMSTSGAMDYVRLARTVGKKIREVAPNEIFVGPAISDINPPGLAFLELCLKNKLLNYWTAISAHPYRKEENPETVLDDYKQLRRLIAKYARNKYVPLISSEWGYSSYWPEEKMDDLKQAKYLVRSWIINLASDIKISIWYKWLSNCDGEPIATHHYRRFDVPECLDDERKRESGYGIRYANDTPKAAWYAATIMANMLKGYHADLNAKSLLDELSENPGPRKRETNYAIRFLRGNDYIVAAWTTSSRPRQVLIHLEPGKYLVTGMFGGTSGKLTAGRNGLRVTLTDAPLYLAPTK